MILNHEMLDIIINIILVSAIIVSIIVTLHYNKKTHEQTDKQLKLTQSNMELRIRPILARTIDPKSNRPAKIESSQKAFFIRFINNGLLSAVLTDKRYNFKIKNNGKIIEKFPKDEEWKVMRGTPFAPTEHYWVELKCPNDIILEEAQNGKDCYFELRLSYKSPDSIENHLNKKHEYHYFLKGHFENGSIYYDEIDVN